MSTNLDAPMDSLAIHAVLSKKSWDEEEACALPEACSLPAGDAVALPTLLTSASSLSPGPKEVEKRAAPMTEACAAPMKEVEKWATPMTEAERQRLKTLLSDFVKTAMKGSPCICIQEGGERMSASYSLDAAMTKLVVRGLQKPGYKLVLECPLAQIKDVYSIAQDGELPFPAPVLAAVHPEEKGQLLMLVCVSELRPDEPLQICLVLDTVECRDTFLECLRMLCLCAMFA